ncbi:uncharacterized protein [Elaeis guineensis]|uniref:uncharacterized protein n=1 Tax=Elaeis guineensis var. tenera TaxID=51953 RepID=UPI003C6D5C58
MEKKMVDQVAEIKKMEDRIAEADLVLMATFRDSEDFIQEKVDFGQEAFNVGHDVCCQRIAVCFPGLDLSFLEEEDEEEEGEAREGEAKRDIEGPIGGKVDREGDQMLLTEEGPFEEHLEVTPASLDVLGFILTGVVGGASEASPCQEMYRPLFMLMLRQFLHLPWSQNDQL